MITIDKLKNKKEIIAVVGLGYVGLPLAVALSAHFSVIGFDLCKERIEQLRNGHDRTGEICDASLAASSLRYTSDEFALSGAGFFIVAVPTPIDNHQNPNLLPVKKASAAVGRNMGKGSVVVYESTVYPGVTEDICVPILEKESGYTLNNDFSVGYSPERINPGDKVHTVENIIKVVSGSNFQTLELLAEVYGTIVKAGVHKAASIKVAEAAKVIENTQRDLNIALINELALIFDRLAIDCTEVLEAAGTKWNFLNFKPGLVGGHCIGVDPYYLTYKAEEVGYHPEVILAGRRINDGMGKFVAEKTVKMLIKGGLRVDQAVVGLMGLTFKENVPDLRNTRVVDIYNELRDYGVKVLVHDPLADPAEAWTEYGIELVSLAEMKKLDAMVLAVRHQEFEALNLASLLLHFNKADKAIVLDLKSLWNKAEAMASGVAYWRL